MNRNQLMGKIESLREELEKLISEKGDFQDEEVINKSRELDNLLVEYSRMLENNKHNSQTDSL